MFQSHDILRLVAAIGLLAFCAGESFAFPKIRLPSSASTKPAGGSTKPPTKGKQQGQKNKGTKATDPLDAAVKALQDAQKDLESKDNTSASQLTRSADQIVSNQDTITKKARGEANESETATKREKDHLKQRAKALDAVLKDIHTAEKNIAARKTDDATTAIKSAIIGLEALIGGGPAKK